MSVRKFENRHVRNIQKSRQSYLVSLPVELIREFGWQERQKVEVVRYGKNKLLIKDWKKK